MERQPETMCDSLTTIVSRSCGNEGDRRHAPAPDPHNEWSYFATSACERDAAAMSTVVRATTISALVLTTVFAGCARRPSVTSMAAAPSAQPAAAAETPPESAGAERRTVVEEGRQEVVVVERPEPATFAGNPNEKPIYFDFDRYEIRPGDAKTLEADAAWLKTNDVRILIEGQCDERGTDEYNLALGDRRARATMNYLVALGIAADRVSTVSYGKERPVCTERTEACWALNRRANIVVKPRG
jgi:peptidoglycan-associated lipoprotein